MLSSIGLILFSVSFVLAQVLVKGTVKDNLGEGVPGQCPGKRYFARNNH